MRPHVTCSDQIGSPKALQAGRRMRVASSAKPKVVARLAQEEAPNLPKSQYPLALPVLAERRTRSFASHGSQQSCLPPQPEFVVSRFVVHSWFRSAATGELWPLKRCPQSRPTAWTS